MFKNIFLASVIAAVLIVSAAPVANALTAEEVQAQIKVLLEKISELTRQLNVLRAQGNTGSSVSGGATVILPAPALKHRICLSGVRTLQEGAQGDEVRALQEFLQSEKIFTAAPTGFFGPVTREALARWQAQNGVDAIGIAGPKTAERIRVWCGFGGGTNAMRFSASPERGTAPLSVTFSTWISGFRVPSIYYTIAFGDGTSERAAHCNAPADVCVSPGQNTHTYTTNGTYTATLNKITDPCPDDGDPTTPRCLAAIQSEVVGKTQIYVGTSPVCTKEYMPICGAKPIVCVTTPCNPIPTTYSNRCMMNTDGASFLYEGACRATTANPADNPQCKSWYDGCNTCSRSSVGGPAMCTLKACYSEMMSRQYCTAYFDGSANRPPTVSGLSGPTTLNVNQSGTWTITASDPENGPLSYSVNWGEATSYLTSAAAPSSESFQQTSIFTHSYASAGTYTVSVIVTDSAGQAAKAATTVKVGDAPVACTMQYDPVCGRPPGCANTCAPGQACPAICQLYTPQTYGNRCVLNGSGAQFLHNGECTATSGSVY